MFGSEDLGAFNIGTNSTATDQVIQFNLTADSIKTLQITNSHPHEYAYYSIMVQNNDSSAVEFTKDRNEVLIGKYNPLGHESIGNMDI